MERGVYVEVPLSFARCFVVVVVVGCERWVMSDVSRVQRKRE